MLRSLLGPIAATICSAVTACAAVTTELIGPWAGAQESQALRWCREDSQAITPDMRISGCTTLIQSGRETQSYVATAFMSRGGAYLDKGEYERAIQDYDQVIRLKPNFAAGFFGRGIAYKDKGDYDRAIQDYDQAIRLEPDFAYFNNRGDAYLKKGEYERAIQDFDQVIRMKPKLAAAFNNRGAAYKGKGDIDRAIQDYDQAIRLEPYFAYFNNRGTAYLDKGDYDRAIQDYDQAIRLLPDFAAGFINRGIAYKDKGDYDRAIQDFDQVIRFKPNSAEALYNRCLTRAVANKELEAALSDCNEALRLRPGDGFTLGWRGFVYFRMGRYDQAMADFDESQSREQKSARFLYLRGLVKRMRHDVAGGDADIAAAKTMLPKVAEEFAGYGVRP